MMRFVGFLLFLATVPQWMVAQELNVKVTMNTPKLQTADPKIFKTLETSISDFMNNQKWTEDIYEQQERINVTLIITITEELGPDAFKADLAIQSSRPVFGSEYRTSMLSQLDKDVTFTYQEYQPVEYTESIYNDNLSSILSFYAYIILGLDYDTFTPFGGEPYFLKAQDIINVIPQGVAASFKGWRPVDGSRNRYWLVENLLTPRLRPMRQALYDYHRQGLDISHKDIAGSRAVMAASLEKVDKANQTYPNSMFVQLFAQAKSSEIINIFLKGTRQEKDQVSQAMMRIDPTRSSDYRKIIF